MSVAWFTRLYRLNDAGKFEEAAAAARRYLKDRPRDYALHLQCGKALLSLGELDAARLHLEASRDHSGGLAAWPWFYLAALHARLGERKELFAAIEVTLQRDPALASAFLESPFFAAWHENRRFRSLVAPRVNPRTRAPERIPSPRRGRGSGRGAERKIDAAGGHRGQRR